MANRVNEIGGQQYERFTDARKANFCNSSKKGARRVKDPFITWLGSPPLGRYGDFVLAFIARETVASITDDAASLRAQVCSFFFVYLTERLECSRQLQSAATWVDNTGQLVSLTCKHALELVGPNFVRNPLSVRKDPLLSNSKISMTQKIMESLAIRTTGASLQSSKKARRTQLTPCNS